MMSAWPEFDSFRHRPSRIFDDDYDFYSRPRSLRRRRSIGDAYYDDDKFEARINVQNFKPEEISVKVIGDTLTIEGRHEGDERGYNHISSELVRKYTLPRNCDVNRLESKLSLAGILTITAPTFNKEERQYSPVVKNFQTVRQQPRRRPEEPKQEPLVNKQTETDISTATKSETQTASTSTNTDTETKTVPIFNTGEPARHKVTESDPVKEEAKKEELPKESTEPTAIWIRKTGKRGYMYKEEDREKLFSV